MRLIVALVFALLLMSVTGCPSDSSLSEEGTSAPPIPVDSDGGGE